MNGQVNKEDGQMNGEDGQVNAQSEAAGDVAVLSDIHGNYEAFSACMEYALERGIKDFIFLGDYLGELGFPQRTMEYLYSIRDRYDCTFIRGNREEYWLNYGNDGKWKPENSATGGMYYVYHSLTKKDMDFFVEMETAKVFCLRHMEAITICHGSPHRVNEALHPGQDNTYKILEAMEGTRLILCGHTHVQRKIEHGGRCILNPGSVGMPLYSCGKAQFMILHGDGDKWREEFISLPYDAEKEIEDLYLAGLDVLAPYWCRVTEHVLRTGKIDHSLVLQKAMQYGQEDEGEAGWPDISERVWKKAYEEYFGQEQLYGYDCGFHPEREAFPICKEKKLIYESRWMSLYSDRVQMPDGTVIDTYYRVHVPGESVCVVIVNEKEEILLIQSKRYTTGRMEWELPAGRIEEGECAESAAMRECREETGYDIKELRYLCSQNPGNGISDILIHYYIARAERAEAGFDRNEVEDMRWVSREAAARMVRNNETRCGVSAFGLLYALQFCICMPQTV